MDKIVVSCEKNKLTTKYYNSFDDSSYSNIFFGAEAKRFLDEIEKRDATDARISKDGKVLRVVYPDRVIFIKDYKLVFENIDARRNIDRYNANKAKRYMNGTRKAKRVSKTGAITKGLLVLLIMVSVLSISHKIKSFDDPFTPNASATWIDDTSQESIEKYLNDEQLITDDDKIILNTDNSAAEAKDPGYDKLLLDTQIISLSDIEEAEKTEPTNGELLAQMVEEKDTIYHNFNIDFSDRTSDEKAAIARENYYNLISRYAKTYGLDANLVMAIATQERAEHSTEIDPGGGIGLMQIQYSVWVNQDVTAYNFETGNWETFHITDSNIRELDTNIKIGCMYFQNCLVNMDYNVPAALCAYNWGTTSARNKISQFSQDRGLTVNEVLEANDTSWVNLFDVDGDTSLAYPKVVLSYYDSSKPIINDKIDENGNDIVVSTTVSSPLIKNK